MVAKSLFVDRTDKNPAYKAHEELRKQLNYSELVEKRVRRRNEMTEEELKNYEICSYPPKYYLHEKEEFEAIQTKYLEMFQAQEPIANRYDWILVTEKYIIHPNNPIVDVKMNSYYYDGLNNDSLTITYYLKDENKFANEYIQTNQIYSPPIFREGKSFKKDGLFIEVDADEATMEKYKKHLQQIEIEKNIKKAEWKESRRKSDYRNMNLGINYSVAAKRGKNPFPKGMVGFQVYSGDGQYGPFVILRFADAGSTSKADNKTIISPLDKWTVYTPSIEMINDEVSDQFGFLGKFLAKHVYENLFKPNGLDLRNYPIEVFDKSICEGLEFISQYPEIIERFKMEWYAAETDNVNLKKEFKALVESFKPQFSETLQVIDEALEENLAVSKSKNK